MDALDNDHSSPGASGKAGRAKRIIIWVMVILILLPFILVWLTNSVGF